MDVFVLAISDYLFRYLALLLFFLTLFTCSLSVQSYENLLEFLRLQMPNLLNNV